jgi:hypothetical protein
VRIAGGKVRLVYLPAAAQARLNIQKELRALIHFNRPSFASKRVNLGRSGEHFLVVIT